MSKMSCHDVGSVVIMCFYQVFGHVITKKALENLIVVNTQFFCAMRNQTF